MPHAVGSVISGLAVFHMVLTGWVFFAVGYVQGVQATFSGAWTVFTRVGKAFTDLPKQFGDKTYGPELLLSFGVIGFLIFVEILEEKLNLWTKLRARPFYLRWAVYYALILGLLAIGVWQQTRFVYMAF